MDAKLLIDAIVRQTTVLIAQLSTSAGIRAPLANAVYGASSEADRGRVAEHARAETVTSMVWLALYRKPSTRAELGAALPFAPVLVDQAVESLIAEGRVRRDGPTLSAESFVVPVGAEQGWEAAVFDHFSAVASAIAAKVHRGARSDAKDVVGGATLTFEVAPDHPNFEEVRGLLARIRRDVNDVWARVMQHNERHPLDDARKIKVTVYFGQNVDESDDDGNGAATDDGLVPENVRNANNDEEAS